MPIQDLNNILEKVQKETSGLQKNLKNLMGVYDDLFRQANQELSTERNASGGKLDGLEDFIMLVRVIKRNRDVMGSLMRGVRSIRPMSGYKFAEEEVPESETQIDIKKLSSLEIVEERT